MKKKNETPVEVRVGDVFVRKGGRTSLLVVEVSNIKLRYLVFNMDKQPFLSTRLRSEVRIWLDDGWYRP